MSLTGLIYAHPHYVGQVQSDAGVNREDLL